MSTPTLAINDSAEVKERIERFREVHRGIVREVRKVIVGQDEVIEQVMISLFVGGHCLITGLPGTAKTLLVRTLAQTLGLVFKRIQFTPDLMPGDIIGSNLFNFQTSTFTLTRGPIFSELLLADEINRTPPKTQAALLEAMQERNVTIDDVGNVAVFLASDLSSQVTADVHFVDAGYHAMGMYPEPAKA